MLILLIKLAVNMISSSVFIDSASLQTCAQIINNNIENISKLYSIINIQRYLSDEIKKLSEVQLNSTA